jgi:hypothetical protein
MNKLKDDIGDYMKKDMNNLKKIIDNTSHNNEMMNKKTNFILDILEEENQFDTLQIPYSSPSNVSEFLETPTGSFMNDLNNIFSFNEKN